MRLVYFRSEIGNVGDDLNPWLWSRILGDLIDPAGTTRFWGIGSILDTAFIERFARAGRQVIFGTGVRYQPAPLRLGARWDVRFVRGPQSAAALGLGARYALADGAYCLGLLPELLPVRRPGGGIACMPYFRSMALVNWRTLCERRGWTFISPLQSPDRVLAQLASCDYLITEAMHGAILADVMRVPWARFSYFAPLNETPAVATFKWADFTESMAVDAAGQVWPCQLGGKRWRRRVDTATVAVRTWRLSSYLEKHSSPPQYRLSNDPLLREKLTRLATEVGRLRADYG